jgi:CobQ-like glutamine amidotransferase family enzyme
MSYSLTIGWLYPELMSTYGDRGNIICLQKRSEWRGIKTTVKRLDVGFESKELETCDFIFMGGAQDTQQKKVSEDLSKKKNAFEQIIEGEIPGLFICGAYQFLGKYYKEADGKILKGLGIFDLYTENPGQDHKRLIGNITVDAKGVIPSYLIGFENHGGRTYLGKNIKPLGKVLKGFGNNDKDEFEGAVYKNSFGTYLHGPILPKNPTFADYLLKKAIDKKYKTKVKLKTLNSFLEDKARRSIAKRIGIEI